MQEAIAAYRLNLTQQKKLFKQMLHFALQQRELVEKADVEIKVEVLEQFLAQRQNLIEQIDNLNIEVERLQSALRHRLGIKDFSLEVFRGQISEPERKQFNAIFEDLLKIMGEIDRQDELTQKLIHTKWTTLGAQVQKVRAANKTALVYQSYGAGIGTESRFIDYKK
ncbi:MAG: flagellar protein FlgN [Syntrophomonadaceae bacterium]|nr:flagellar protein FlgN [Syntrophomonadaceae bacterium]